MYGKGLAGKRTLGILVAAVLPLPYAYYMFPRWAVTLSAGFHLGQRRPWGMGHCSRLRGHCDLVQTACPCVSD